MIFTKAERRAYRAHRKRAEEDGIEFLLTMKEWVTIWLEEKGPDWMTLRGQGRKYCMARNGPDIGPYAVGNVRIITGSENSSEARNKGKRTTAALTLKTVRQIFLAEGAYHELCVRFNVNYETVCSIKTRRRWAFVTEGMVPAMNSVGRPKGRKYIEGVMTKNGNWRKKRIHLGNESHGI